MVDKIIQNLKVITLNIDFSVSYKKKEGQATYIAPLDFLPLLRSRPGGFGRSWSYKTYPTAKVMRFL